MTGDVKKIENLRMAGYIKHIKQTRDRRCETDVI